MRRRLVWLVGMLVLGSVGGLWLASRGGPGGPSTRSAAPGGWLGAHRYLEAAGEPVARRERPPGAGIPAGTLVVTFPWSRTGPGDEIAEIDAHLARGGTLVVGHSTGLRPAPPEAAFLESLGIGILPFEEDLPPLGPVRWWRWVRRDRALEPAEGVDARTLAVSRSRWRAVPPGTAVAWLVGLEGEPAVSLWERRGGRVVLFPAELLSNRRLHDPSHRAFLATLRRLGDGTWTFDEYHHGWTAPGVVESGGEEARAAWDRLLMQLGLVYFAIVWALAWRMGPPWQPTRERAGGSGEFLRRLGRVHRELGHASQAATRLLERSEALDPRFRAGPERRRAAAAAGERELLALARATTTGGKRP